MSNNKDRAADSSFQIRSESETARSPHAGGCITSDMSKGNSGRCIFPGFY
ncbi:MAG: hypothetical protein JWM58_2474 [Rhizobium sp.]|nr:hypothetical protein [Rhizobium sp.]